MTTKKKVAFMSLITTLGLVASITSTVAWFNGASYLEYNGVVIRVPDESDFLIKPEDEEEYTDFISSEQFKNQNSQFEPISSAFRNTWVNKKKEKKPLFTTSYVDKTQLVVNDPRYYNGNKYFIETFNLLSDKDIVISLNAEVNTTKVYGNDVYNRAQIDTFRKTGIFADYTDTQIVEKVGEYISKSLRFSVLIFDEENANANDPGYSYYVINPTKKDGEDTYLGGVLSGDGNNNQYYNYLENGEVSNIGTEILYGEVDNIDKIIYNEPSSQDSEYRYDDFHSCFNAMTKAGVRGINIEKSLQNGLKIQKENALSLAEAQEQMKIYLYKDEPRDVVVSIYLEGWDHHCINAIRSAGFKAELYFTVTSHHSGKKTN